MTLGNKVDQNVSYVCFPTHTHVLENLIFPNPLSFLVGHFFLICREEEMTIPSFPTAAEIAEASGSQTPA